MHTKLSKAEAAAYESFVARRQHQKQRAEGLFGALIADTRLRKAAGITKPNPSSATNRMLAPGEAAAEAERRLGRPETTHERQLRESADAQARVTEQIKAMHNGSTPSTGPKAL